MAELFPGRAALEANQLEQLRSLLAELFPGNKFYSRKLNAAGITFDMASLEDFSARFPFTTKSELAEDQRRNPPFGSNLTYPLECYTRYHQSSGTSGAPLRWLDTPESWEWMLESWTEILRAAGVGAPDRVFFAFSFGPFIGFWMAFESAARLGCLCLPGGGLSSAARLQSILDNGATVLCCTPTYAIRLAEAAAEEKIDLGKSRVRTLIVAGEPGGSIPAVRARLTELWRGARVFDHHGMTEVGPVTYECPARPGVLHAIERAYFAEIVEPASGKPLPPGQTGELVLTTLGRTGSPLLRYRTGDLVKAALPELLPTLPPGAPASLPASSHPDKLAGKDASAPGLKQLKRSKHESVREVPSHSSEAEGRSVEPRPCLCGRYELALEGGILGRADDMVVVRGVNVYPGAVDEIVRSCAGVAEYQVEIATIRSLPEMSLLVEPTPDCADLPDLVRRLERGFETALALRVPITLAATGSLPRFDLKGKRWSRR